jgi:GNAT superfamily N-acetyltransferase
MWKASVSICRKAQGAAMPAITVAPAGLEHVSAMAELLDEMQRYYRSASARPVGQLHRQIREALFATPPAARAQLAWHQSQLAGIAAYSFLWPAAGLTRSLYLKELYVATAHRRLGIVTLLMRSLTAVASDHGCSRIEWTADAGSAGARAFYSKLGISPLPSKIFYRIEHHGSGLRLPG